MSVLQTAPDTSEYLGAFSFTVVFFSFFLFHGYLVEYLYYYIGICKKIHAALKLIKINTNLIEIDNLVTEF